MKYAEALVQKVDKFHKLLQPATRQGNIFTPVCDSVHGGVSVQGRGLCPGGGVSVQGEGSLSRGGFRGSLSGVSQGVSLSRGVSVQGGLCPEGISVQGGLYQGGPSPASRLRAGGTHTTGMHFCSNSGQFKKVKF